MDRLKSRWPLGISIAAIVVCTIMFGQYRQAAGGQYLDRIVSHQKAQKHLDEMSDEEIAIHRWVTLCIDSAFPIAYSLLLIGLVTTLSDRKNRLVLCWPAILAPIFDYSENVTHLMAFQSKQIPFAKMPCSLLKWLLLLLAIGAVVFAFFDSGEEAETIDAG